MARSLNPPNPNPTQPLSVSPVRTAVLPALSSTRPECPVRHPSQARPAKVDEALEVYEEIIDKGTCVDAMLR